MKRTASLAVGIFATATLLSVYALPLPTPFPGAVYTNNTEVETTNRGTRFYNIPFGKIVYYGTWARRTGDSLYNNDHHVSNRQYSVCYFFFKGTAVRWIGCKGPDHGVADVYFDGEFQQTVDSYAPSAVTKAVLFEKSGLNSDRTHILKIIVRKERNRRATNCYQSVDCFEAVSPVNYDAEIATAASAELSQIRAGTHSYLPPTKWSRVAYAARPPRNGVTLQGGVLNTCFNALVKYLNSSTTLQSRNTYVVGTGPTYCCENWGCWSSWLPGSSEGRMLAGAANVLRWGERTDMRNIVNTIIADIKGRQRADGYHNYYPESDFAMTDKSGNNERKNYDRVFWTRGLLAAGESGNADAYDIARKFYDWFNACAYLPRMMDGPNAINGFPGGGLMYLSPIGKSDDLLVTMRYYDQNWWKTELANQQPFCFSNFPVGEPHCYLLLGLEAMLDEYMATGDVTYRDAVLGGWKMYLDNFIHVGGTAAICEDSYYPPQSYYLSKYTGEACGHNFWLWINSKLLQLYPTEEKYATEIERVIYNCVMGSQDSTTGYIRYINRIHRRKDEPWCRTTCCEVSTVNTISLLPQYIYSIADDGLYVNLFAASTITWRRNSRDVTLATTTLFPYANNVTMRLTVNVPETMTLRIRVPSWASGAMAVQVNGNTVGVGTPGTYLALNRTWTNNDSISFVLPAGLRTVRYTGFDQIRDYERHALLYGPVLLSLVGPLNVPDSVPLIATTAQNLPGILETVVGKPLQYNITGYPNYKYLPYWQVSTQAFTCFPMFLGDSFAVFTTNAATRLSVRDITLSVNKLSLSGVAAIRVRYTIPAGVNGAQVLLELFDVRGRLAGTAVNASNTVGDHESLFDTRNLAAGYYFCRMTVQAGDQRATKTAQFAIER